MRLARPRFFVSSLLPRFVVALAPFPSVAGESTPLLALPTAQACAPAGIALATSSPGLAARVTASGLTCHGRSRTLAPARDVTVSLRTTTFGRSGAERFAAAAELRGDGERAELARPEFVEWFTPHEQGVEHGWTVAQRPAGDPHARLWIGVAFEGLAPKLEESGASVRLVDELSQDRLYYRGLSAVDASGKRLDARFAVRGPGLGIEVDDRGAAYPVTVDPVLSSLYWSYSPNLSPSEFSSPTRNGGDINGDGYSDLILNQPYRSTTAPYAGAILVWFGPVAGVTSPPDQLLELSPPIANYHFANAVGVGDADGDGYGDVVAGANGYSSPEASEGALFFLRGSPTGLVMPSGPFFETDSVAAELGRAIAQAGDVNGDGYADVIAGSGTYNVPPLSDAGAAFLFLGSPAGFSSTPAWSQYGTAGNQQYGEHVAGVGDVNADGFDDWVVTAIGFSNPDVNEGIAYLYLGSGSVASTTGTMIREGNEAAAVFGNSVQAAGDVDGDGFGDVLIAGSGIGGGRGRAFLYYGSPTGLGANPWFLDGPSGAPEQFGSHVSTAGDVNGDGFADLLIAAIDYNVFGRVQLYFGSVNGPVVPAAIELLPTALHELYGHTIATAGDVNGDGLSDVLVGDPYYSNPEVHEGIVELYLGQPSLTPLVTPLAGQTASLAGTTGSSFATALTTAGDVNGDGYCDLLVGAPDFDGAHPDEGRVLLYLGSASGLASTPIWTFSSGIANAELGAGVAFAGDVNDDGFGDVLIGAPAYTNGHTNEGRAYLFFGTASGVLSSTPDWTFESDQIVEKFGAAVAGAGDVDGDGYTDAFIGAPGATLSSIQNSGRVYDFKGSPTGLGAVPAMVVNAPVAGDFRFGASVADAGDVNRDGRTDLLVGAPDFTNGQTREGTAYLFLGSGNSIAATPVLEIESNQSLAALGFAVSAAGDVDSDGFADFVVGAPDHAGGGRAWLYRGQSGPVPIAPGAQVFLSPQNGARFGAALARAGDVNNDGFSDVAIGTPNWNTDQGKVQLFLGVSSGLAASPALEFDGAAGVRLGEGLGPCGDIDGDGFSDVVLGQPGHLSDSGGALIYVGSTQYGGVRQVQQRQTISTSVMHLLALQTESIAQVLLEGGSNNASGVRSTPAGRERVALAWEIKGASALLDGTGLARGVLQDVGAPTGSLTLSEVVGGLTPSQRYQWRTRIATANPMFPHGLWTQLQGNGQDEKKFGTGFDCNGNGIPDSTEVAQNPSIDCNGNGAPDSCDVAGGVDPDCDNDGVPNSCELFANDCNANLLPDDCEVAAGGASVDCNANSVLDTCEVNGSTDANGDSILDVCQFVPFCFGDGTGTACPCGNSGGAGRGCANSVNANGAVLTVTGVPSLVSDTLVLHGAGMPNSVSPSAIYLQGTLEDNGGFGTPIQDGLRCVTGSLVRLGTRPNSGNQSQYPDAGNQIISIRGGLVGQTPPVTRHYQVFYRNAAAAFCPPGTANWTNGLIVTWH